MAGNARTRNWTAVFYPESCPENWRDIITNWHARAYVSPLHDQDKNPDAEGGGDAIKKAHYHLVVCYDGPKSFEQVKENTDELNGTIPQRVDSLRGMIRYLVHMDNPEKAQYSKADISLFNGADLDVMFAPSPSQMKQMRRDIIDFIKEHNITEFSDLVDKLDAPPLSLEHPDWSDIVAEQKTVFFSAYLRSRKYKEVDKFRYSSPKRMAVRLEFGAQVAAQMWGGLSSDGLAPDMAFVVMRNGDGLLCVYDAVSGDIKPFEAPLNDISLSYYLFNIDTREVFDMVNGDILEDAVPESYTIPRAGV